MRDPRERSSDKERTILSCDTFQGRVCTKARARLETRRKNRNRVKFQTFPDPYRATERFFRADPPTRRPYISSSSLPPPQQQIILFPPLAFRLERKLFKIGTTLRDKVKRERETIVRRSLLEHSKRFKRNSVGDRSIERCEANGERLRSTPGDHGLLETESALRRGEERD